jgi:anti-anti-sigma regulatory factor
VSDSEKGADETAEGTSWLRVELHTRGRGCTLVLTGVLCTTSIAALEAQVDQLGCVPCDDVLVDVRGLTDLDAVGASVLLGLHHYVDGRGGHLHIAGASAQIAPTLHQYALEYTEADEALTKEIDGSAPAVQGAGPSAEPEAVPPSIIHWRPSATG